MLNTKNISWLNKNICMKMFYFYFEFLVCSPLGGSGGRGSSWLTVCMLAMGFAGAACIAN